MHDLLLPVIAAFLLGRAGKGGTPSVVQWPPPLTTPTPAPIPEAPHGQPPTIVAPPKPTPVPVPKPAPKPTPAPAKPAFPLQPLPAGFTPYIPTPGNVVNKANSLLGTLQPGEIYRDENAYELIYYRKEDHGGGKVGITAYHKAKDLAPGGAGSDLASKFIHGEYGESEIP